MPNLVVRKHTERYADRGDDGRDACDVLALAYEVKTAAESGHYHNEREYLAEDGRPSNRAIVAATVHAVFLGHPHDTLGKAGDNRFKPGKLLGLRQRSDSQLAVLRDDRGLSAFLKLVLLTLRDCWS